MKPVELKNEYIRLRAEGRSYSYICEQLHISKATCTKWEKDLAEQITELKRAELEELCETYGMVKEARIKRIGETLDKINGALNNADFSSIDPAKLLDFKLKYMEALKSEYSGTLTAKKLGGVDGKHILDALEDLLDRIRTGEVTTEQAQKETTVLTQLLKAYEATELEDRLKNLEAIMGRVS